MNTNNEAMESGPLTESSQHKPILSTSGDLIRQPPVGLDRVWIVDAAGVSRRVYGVDAAEICALGGRLCTAAEAAEMEEK